MTQVHTHTLQKGYASPKVILVIEDDASNAACIADLISQETPYHVFVATNGSDALNFVSHIKPNLLIVDYRLPGINGIELYDHLHALEELKATPAILLSACLDDCLDAIETRKLLAFHKPFDIEDFLYSIEGLLSSPSDDSTPSLLSDTLS